MPKTTRKGLRRTIRRSCKRAEGALRRAESAMHTALHHQFADPNLGVRDDEREILEAWFRQHLAEGFQQLHSMLSIDAVDVVRFRAQLQAELQIDARLQKETAHEHDNEDAP